MQCIKMAVVDASAPRALHEPCGTYRKRKQFTDKQLPKAEGGKAWLEHELCQRCKAAPSDAVPAPVRLGIANLKMVTDAMSIDAATGALHALNGSAVATLHGGRGFLTETRRTRLQELAEELERARVHVQEAMMGPIKDKDISGEIYQLAAPKPWEVSAIGASRQVIKARASGPSARSYEGDSRAEREVRDRAFGRSARDKRQSYAADTRHPKKYRPYVPHNGKQ